jgi:hypothetical protein
LRRAQGVLLVAALAAPGCYAPHPADGAFRCAVDLGRLCPTGLSCDVASGLCVRPSTAIDMGYGSVDFSADAGLPLVPQSCDDRVRAGALSGLTNLTAANSAQAESALALSGDGKRMYFLRAGALYTATIDPASPKAVGAVTPVTVAGFDSLNGGTVATDGSYWFSGTKGNVTRLYSGTLSAGALTVSATSHAPQGMCVFSGPVFLGGDPTSELYLAYPLAGCSQPASYVAVGLTDRNIGAFVSALMLPGYRAPSLLTGGRTLLVSTSDTRRLAWAERPDANAQWTGPHALPLDGLGVPSGGDDQAVVSPDCKTLYLVADRAGGLGGTDLWAADIAQD